MNRRAWLKSWAVETDKASFLTIVCLYVSLAKVLRFSRLLGPCEANGRMNNMPYRIVVSIKGKNEHRAPNPGYAGSMCAIRVSYHNLYLLILRSCPSTLMVK